VSKQFTRKRIDRMHVSPCFRVQDTWWAALMIDRHDASSGSGM